MAIAFVLSGGGAKGDFEVGALQFLFERGIKPEIVCGTSVGAINAAVIAEGPGGIEKLVDQWLILMRNDDMYLEEPWFRNVDARLHELISRITNHTLSSPVKIASSIIMPLGFIADSILLNLDLDEVRRWYEQAKRAKSLFNLSPIESKMRGDQGLNSEMVRQSGIKLRLAMVSLESGELQFVSEYSMLFPPGQVTGSGQQVDLVSAVLASAAIPFVFPPVKLAGENYVDGGVREIVPIKAAIQLGANQIFAIVSSKFDIDRVESFDDKNLLDIGARAAEEIMPSEITRNETHPFGGWGNIDVKIIQPRFEAHDTMTIDPGLIRIAMSYGFMRAADVVEQGGQDFYSSAITEQRRKIWEWEHDVFGVQHFMPTTYKRITKIPRYDENGAIVTDRDTGAFPTEQEMVHFIRRQKWELARLVHSRRRGSGALPQGPPGFETWWTKWENHNWPSWVVEDRWPDPWGQVWGVEPEQPPRLLTLTLIANPQAGGRAEGSDTYVSGTQTAARAYANPNFAFRDWTTADGRIVSNNPLITVTMDSDKTLVANFEATTRPPNDDRANAIEIAPGFSAEFNTAKATTEASEPQIMDCGGNGNPHIGKTIWFRYRPTTTGMVGYFAETRTFDVVVGVYEDGSLIECAWAAYQGVEGEEITGAGGWFEARVGSTYEFQVGGADSEGGILRFSLRLSS